MHTNEWDRQVDHTLVEEKLACALLLLAGAATAAAIRVPYVYVCVRQPVCLGECV